MEHLNLVFRRIPFAFLEDIHNRFVRTYGRAILSAPAYAMNEEFSRVLSQQMDYYSSDPNADRLNRLKGEMTQASSIFMYTFTLYEDGVKMDGKKRRGEKFGSLWNLFLFIL
ncbi:hypothetical protein Lal_00039217 [Lupinus albus]|nr:hypothetical protein Lal_00039217 [Lupinus albus]